MHRADANNHQLQSENSSAVLLQSSGNEVMDYGLNFSPWKTNTPLLMEQPEHKTPDNNTASWKEANGEGSRSLAGYVFAALSHLLQCYCVQCGFKMFTRAAARKLFTNIRLKRWCFDVEIVYLCKHLRIPMVEVSVNWTEIPGSKVRMTSILHMMAQDGQVDVPLAGDGADDDVVHELNGQEFEGNDDDAPDQQAPGGAGAHADDREFLNNMRGWLMTVATLFVTMAFQVMMHPPEWLFHSRTTSSCEGTARVPHYYGNNTKAIVYLNFNVMEFAIALTLVHVLLLKRSNPRNTIIMARELVLVVSVLLAVVFALGISESFVGSDTIFVSFTIAFFAAYLGILFGLELICRFVVAVYRKLMGR